jgi:hypothetical protein
MPVLRLLVIAMTTIGLAACGDGGVEAPPVGDMTTVCAGRLCADYPIGWEVESGDGFISFRHPLDSDSVLATVGLIDLAGLVEAAGGSWPASTPQAAAAFWELLGEDASLDGITPGVDGSVSSRGELGDLVLWHRIVPDDPPRAVGVEVRAPNEGWVEHAEAILDGARLEP